MKKMNKLTVAALAFAAISLASTAASAANVTAAPGDLILGFQIASGTGSSSNLEVDLGAYTQFTTSATLTFGSQLAVSDLTGTYGPNWASTLSGTGVQWSVAGTSTGSDAFYGTSLTAIRTNSNLTVPYGAVSGLVQSGGLNAAPQASTAYSAVIGNSLNPASGIANSYTSLEGGTGYGYIQNPEQTGAGVIELYSFTEQAKVGTGGNAKFPFATDLGSFTLGSDGSLAFTGVAVAPEPSSYALLLVGVAGLLLVQRLRRKTVA